MTSRPPLTQQHLFAFAFTQPELQDRPVTPDPAATDQVAPGLLLPATLVTLPSPHERFFVTVFTGRLLAAQEPTGELTGSANTRTNWHGGPPKTQVFARSGQMQGLNRLPPSGNVGLPCSGLPVFALTGRTTPAPEPHHRLLGAERLLKGEQKTVSETLRRQANARAVQSLKKSGTDHDALERYSGGGGLGENFDAYYTPHALSELMWQMLAQPRTAPVTVLDPTCGSGHLLAGAPKGACLTGVEAVAESAMVAQRLYPHANVVHADFEDYHQWSPDAFFDAAIVNPPFGPRRRRDVHPKWRLYEEFIPLAVLDRLTPLTGLCLLIIPAQVTHNPTQRAWRAELLRRGMLLYAGLLPDQTFQAGQAGVTTALLLIRRHDLGVQQALETLSDGQVAEALDGTGLERSGRPARWLAGTLLYSKDDRLRPGETQHRFSMTDHAQGVALAGTSLLLPTPFGSMRYPGAPDLSPSRVQAVLDLVGKGLNTAPVTFDGLLGAADRSLHLTEEELRRAEQAAQRLPIVQTGPLSLGAVSPDGLHTLTRTGWKRQDELSRPDIAEALDLARALGRFLETRTERDALTLENVRTHLLRQDAAYRARHGSYPEIILRHLIPSAPVFAHLLAHLQGGRLNVAPRARQEIRLTGTPEEILVKLADLTWLNEETLAQHAKLSAEQAGELLSARACYAGPDAPGGAWQLPGSYYTGNAVMKSEAARALAMGETGRRQRALLIQADEFLRRAGRATPETLDLAPRDPAVPVAVLAAWVNHQLRSIDVTDQHRPVIAVRRESGGTFLRLRSTGTRSESVQARKWVNEQEARRLQDYLNFSTPLDPQRKPGQTQGTDQMQDTDQEQERAEQAARLTLAQEYEDNLRDGFLGWLPGSGHQEAVLEAYNQAYRSELTAQGHDGPIDLPGYCGPVPHAYQNADVRSLIASPGVLASPPGYGKTLTSLRLIALNKRQGHAQNPACVVPASVVGRWVSEASRAFPAWRLTVIGMSPVLTSAGAPVYKKKRDGSVMVDRAGNKIARWREDRPAERQQKLAAVAAGQSDLLILSYESFIDLPLHQEEIDTLIDRDPQLDARAHTRGRFDARSRRGRHDELKLRASFRGRMSRRMPAARPGQLSFSSLALDLLIFDEAHRLRNAYALPSVYGGETPRFLGHGTESDRAIDALYKARLTRRRGGRVTPVTASYVWNSPLDALSVMNLARDDLAQWHMDTAEAVLDRYVRVEPRIVTGLDGEVDLKPAVIGFYHLEELRRTLYSVVRVHLPGDPDLASVASTLKVPALRQAEHPFDMSPEQGRYYQALKEELKVNPADLTPEERAQRHPFKILWNLRLLSLDPALVGVDGENPRFIQLAAEACATREKGEKTLIFMSVGESGGSFERLRQVLVEAGYPEDEIRLATGQTCKGAFRRQDLEDDFNYGDTSLIIGSDLLREGLDLQVGTGAVLHADLPWNWQGLHQRNGRACRQGNPLPEVTSHVYLMRGGFDVIIWTILRGKQFWETLLARGGCEAIHAAGQDFSTEEYALLLSSDPEQTARDIAQRKEALAEQTGRAKTRQLLVLLKTAIEAEERARTLTWRADAAARDRLRRALPGVWSTAEHRAILAARRAAEQARAQVQASNDFPLGRLLDVRASGTLSWNYGLPLHSGMTFTLHGRPHQIERIDKEKNGARVSVPGENHTFTDHRLIGFDEVARGLDFRPNPSDSFYSTSTATPSQTPEPINVHTDPDTRASVLLAEPGSLPDPLPVQGGLSFSLAVRGEATENTERLSETERRRLLATGYTLVQYLALHRQNGLHVQQVQVTVADEAARARTERTFADPVQNQKLRLRLGTLLEQMLGA